MDIGNIVNHGLKTFRLIPFVIVSYYLISAVFAGNFKMFILFVGLILSTLVVAVLSRMSYNTIYGENDIAKVYEQIKAYSIFNLGVEPLSFLPFSLNIYAFLLCYYLYVSLANTKEQKDNWNKNWGIIVTLFILLVIDIIYFGVIFKDKAALVIIIPIMIGAILGVIWPVLIGKTNWAVTVADSNATCSPSSTTYKCNLTTNGNLIQG